MLKKHKPDIDFDTLHKNAEKHRIQNCIERVRKKVVVFTPDGSSHEFQSITHACKEIELRYNIRLALSSVSRSISQRKPVKGFVFNYSND